MSDLSKQAGILTATEFFRFFVKTVIGIALARLITPNELGSYRQLFLIYSTFSTLLLLGIPQSMLYFLPKCSSFDQQKRIITRSLNLISILALLFALGILLLRGFIADKFNNPQLGKLLFFYAVYPLFMFVTQIFSSIVMGLKAPLRAAKFTVFAILSDFILILGVALFTRNLFYIVWAAIISAFLQWLYARIKLLSFHTLKPNLDIAGLKTQLHYCLPLGISTIIGTLSVQLDKLMISVFFTPSQFAVFSLGAMELPLVGILGNSIYAVLLPALSSGNPSEMGSLYSGAVRKNALLVFPIMALFYLFAKPLMIFLYGDIYAEAAVYFRIYLLALPVKIAIYDVLFQAFGKTRIIMFNSLLILVINGVLNYILILQIGMKGAALATVAVTWLAMLLYIAQMKHILALKLRDYFPIAKIFKTIAATACAAIISYPVIAFFTYPLLSIALGTFVFCIVYLLLGRWFKAILPYDLHLVKNLLTDGIKPLRKMLSGKL